MLPKITRGTLADQVTDRLLEYIEAQHLQPGDLLPSETSLVTSFGVSRPVIREALKSLEGKGIIEIVNGKGALIRPIDSDPLRLFFRRAMQMEYGTMLELMEVRKGLEVQSAVLAAQRRDEKDLASHPPGVQRHARSTWATWKPTPAWMSNSTCASPRLRTTRMMVSLVEFDPRCTAQHHRRRAAKPRAGSSAVGEHPAHA